MLLSFKTYFAVFSLLFLILVYFAYNFSSDYNDTLEYYKEKANFNDFEINYALRRRYITSSFDHPADLGNMLFRFASLYGIGRTLDRIPYVHASIESQNQGLTELSESFPLLHEFIEIKAPHKSLVKLVDLSDDCCIYENPEKLIKYEKSKYLKVSGNYLQSYKFFNQYYEDIKKLMECSDSIKEKAAEIAKEIWKNDYDSHKLCIHVRRGDFVPYWPLETRTDFVAPATEYIFKELQYKDISKISLFNFGNDKDFIKKNMNFPNLNFTSITNLFPYATTRSFDMCFAIQYCDTFLMSASSSTYSWWVGYLMKSQGSVYYNAVVTKVGTHPKDTHDFDLFLPYWKKLLVKNGRVTEEKRWTLERKKKG